MNKIISLLLIFLLAGVMVFSAVGCNTDEQASSKIVHVHSYGDWETTITPTCTQKGLKTRTCTDCKKTETEYVEKLEHTEVVDEAISPTCTQQGLTKGTHCSLCNAVIEEPQALAPLGHNEVIDKAVKATCSSAGLTQGSHCERCGEILIKQTSIPRTGHNEKNGRCANCNTITNAYSALAYYVLTNGLKDNDDSFLMKKLEYNNGNKSYFFIHTNSSASSLTLSQLYYHYDGTEILVDMELTYNSNIQVAYMVYQTGGMSIITSGKIYSNTYNDANKAVYDFQYSSEDTYINSSLALSLKDLFSSEISLMLSGIKLLLSEINIGVNISMLGFSNF